ncbi:MAG: hypothetical protein RL616_944 [Verrucomicrobiota bacterium]
MVMPNVSHKNSPRPATILRRSTRTATRSRVLGIILLSALLHRAGSAHGAVIAGPYGAVVNWNRSPDPKVTGYRIYYGTSSGHYLISYPTGNLTSNTVAGLTAGVTYFFAVTAYGTNGIESPFSEEINFVPGQPLVQLLAAPNHEFALTVDGLIAHSYDIEATQDFKTWTVIGNVTTGAVGSTSFTDTNAALFTRRFYRTKATP